MKQEPKQETQTAVEWLVEELGAYLPISIEDVQSMIEQAKEMEKQQLECAWNSSDQNMRFQFSSSAYKAITFKQWLKNFKEE
jgi:hypothetical protein